jgi:Rieske Fe-S protein
LGYLWPSSQTSAGTDQPEKVGTPADFPAGTAKVVSVNDKPVIVVNTAQGGLKAFSAICTHLGCIVGWDTGRGMIVCPCHDAHFNPVNGAVISGPAPSPLPELKLTAQGDVVYVSRG